MFLAFQSQSEAEILHTIEENIRKYGLSKENKDGFLRFRDDYNKNQSPLDLYTLACFSFNYQFRFNSQLQYNNPFGANRSHFSPNMKKNLLAFVKRLRTLDISFTNFDFTSFNTSKLACDDFVYCDPPYLITTGSYNDGNRGFKDWKEEQENQLYALLDELNQKNVRFALSNVLTHKGNQNNLLIDWSKQYRVLPLSYGYSNSSHNTTRGSSEEVLIVNY